MATDLIEESPIEETRLLNLKGTDSFGHTPDALLLDPDVDRRPASTHDHYPQITAQPSTSYPEAKLNDKDLSPLVPLSMGPPNYRKFKLLQEWEGIVDEVCEDVFWARLIDLTNRNRPDESMELPLDMVSETDRPLVLPGSIFYLNIGYHTTLAGQRSRVTEIRFRRTPRWSRNQLESMKTRGQAMRDWVT